MRDEEDDSAIVKKPRGEKKDHWENALTHKKL